MSDVEFGHDDGRSRVEFLGADEAGAPRPPKLPRRGPAVRPWLLGGLVLALAAVGVAVLARGDRTGSRPAGQHAASRAPSVRRPAAAPASLPSPADTLSIPESVVFGPQAIDVAAIGNRVAALTPTLVGIADRDGGAVTVRSAPLDITGDQRTGHLFYDADFHVLWVVSLGGTSFGAYAVPQLDSLSTLVAPYDINAATVMNGQLWFTTDHGLYFVSAPTGRPERVPGPRGRLGALTAEPALRTVLVSDYAEPSTVRRWTTKGPLTSTRLPIAIDWLASTPGGVWALGARGDHAAVERLDPQSLAVSGGTAALALLGTRAQVAATYGDLLLVRGQPLDGLYCLDARSGALKQRWSGPAGPATINARGVLVGADEGIEVLNARDCLAG